MNRRAVNRNVAIVVATAVCCGAHVQPGQGAELVGEGTAVAVIVTRDKPLPVVQAVAEEFQYHVRKASGAELRIVSESQRPESGAGAFPNGVTSRYV